MLSAYGRGDECRRCIGGGVVAASARIIFLNLSRGAARIEISCEAAVQLSFPPWELWFTPPDCDGDSSGAGDDPPILSVSEWWEGIKLSSYVITLVTNYS